MIQTVGVMLMAIPSLSQAATCFQHSVQTSIVLIRKDKNTVPILKIFALTRLVIEPKLTTSVTDA